MEVMSLNSCDQIKSGAVRDVVGYASFEYVERLVKTERGMRQQRRNYTKLVETLGEQYFKVPQLNKRAFVCINEGEADRYIEGLSVLASPPLTIPPSMKTSVAKSELMKAGTPKVKTPSSIEAH